MVVPDLEILRMILKVPSGLSVLDMRVVETTELNELVLLDSPPYTWLCAISSTTNNASLSQDKLLNLIISIAY